MRIHRVISVRLSRDEAVSRTPAAIAAFALVLLGIFALWIGLHPDGHGRPPGGSVLAGTGASTVGCALLMIGAFEHCQRRGWLPLVAAVSWRGRWRIGGTTRSLVGRGQRFVPGRDRITIAREDSTTLEGRGGVMIANWLSIRVGASPPQRYGTMLPLGPGVLEGAVAALAAIGCEPTANS